MTATAHISWYESKPQANPWFAPDAKYIYDIERREGGDWDEARRMIVQAADSKEARKLASERCRDEGPGVWLDTKKTKLKKIALARKPNGKDAPKSRVIAVEGLSG